jgi:hypothetical protein
MAQHRLCVLVQLATLQRNSATAEVRPLSATAQNVARFTRHDAAAVARRACRSVHVEADTAIADDGSAGRLEAGMPVTHFAPGGPVTFNVSPDNASARALIQEDANRPVLAQLARLCCYLRSFQLHTC